MSRRKKYTVGLWMDVPFNLQIWDIQQGEVKEPDLKWFTVVLAKSDDEALEHARQEYSNKKHEAA